MPCACAGAALAQGKEFIADHKEAQSTTLAANVASVNEELHGIIDSLHAGVVAAWWQC